MLATSMLFVSLFAASAEIALPSEPTEPLSLPAPSLAIELTGSAVNMTLHGQRQPFLGFVLASLDGTVQEHTGLPPLFVDYAVLAAGVSPDGKGLLWSLPTGRFPSGVEIHLQGVTWTDGRIASTEPQGLVLDETWNDPGQAEPPQQVPDGERTR